MSPTPDATLKTPDDVHTVRDSAGHSFKLPGVIMTWRECALTWFWLSILPGVVMPLFALWQDEGWAQALQIAGISVLVMALITPVFIGLGAIAQRNGGLNVRVEPRGAISYWSFGTEVKPQIPVAELTDVNTPQDGPPRVLLVSDKRTLIIRTRTWEHARWLAQRIQAARP